MYFRLLALDLLPFDFIACLLSVLTLSRWKLGVNLFSLWSLYWKKMREQLHKNIQKQTNKTKQQQQNFTNFQKDVYAAFGH